MPESKQTFYLTTPIYYVNARPHIGHAYTTIVADVLARRHRLLGDDTFFLTGTDEHGQKIERSAAAAGIAPQQFADRVSAEFRALWDRMGLTYDRFIRTTDENHKRGVQKLFATLYEKGFIYLDSYTGAYCVSDEAFVDVQPGEPCPDCGRITEEITEENFFFKLSAFQKPLIDLIESGELKIENTARRNEVLSFLRGSFAAAAQEFMNDSGRPQPIEDAYSPEDVAAAINAGYLLRTQSGELYNPKGLRDLSVSRSSFTWGIPVPEPAASTAAQQHVIYVWLDALANYMTAIGYGSDEPAAQAEFAKFWPADLHLVGKEIIRFHCVYWPAFLLAAGLPLPKSITAHGWLLFDNAKMSKSKGNIVRTETILNAFGALCPPVRVAPSSKENATGNEDSAGTESFVKGTASAVPQNAREGAALAGEVRTPTPHERDLFAADVLRYFLLREIPFGQDGSFSFDAMVTRYNADLANGYGNFVSRTLAMIHKYFDGVVPEIEGGPQFFHTLQEYEDGLFLSVRDGEAGSGTARKSYPRGFATYDFASSLWNVEQIISDTDQFLTAAKPWKLDIETDSEYLKKVLYTAADAVLMATKGLYPFLPFATARVWSQLGLGDIEEAARNGELKNLQWGGLKPGTKLGPLAPIFPRADKGLAQIMIDIENENTPPSATASSEASFKSAVTPAPAAQVATDPSHPAAPPRTGSLDEPSGALSVAGSAAITTERPGTPPHTEAHPSGVFASAAAKAPETPSQITIDDFAKVELRVAQILVAERIPKADKLLRLEVDLGYEKRQILSGIAEWYTPEDLVGRRIVVITNLAPRKMRGLESHGMLLAASEGEGGKPVLASFGEDIALGSRLK